MAKKRAPEMSLARWLKLARSATIRSRIGTDNSLRDFQTIVRVVARRETLDWDEATAILHMVYGWMPTKLRAIKPHTPAERDKLVAALKKAKRGVPLDGAELGRIQNFSNRSIVGASKVLHVLHSEIYPIWDSRVANAFLWKGVTRATFIARDRYIQYVASLRKWVSDPDVKQQCAELRTLNPALVDSADARVVELVLFRRYK